MPPNKSKGAPAWSVQGQKIGLLFLSSVPLAVLWLLFFFPGSTRSSAQDEENNISKPQTGQQHSFAASPVVPFTAESNDTMVADLALWLQDHCNATSGKYGLDNLFLSDFVRPQAQAGQAIRGLGTLHEVKKNEDLLCVAPQCMFNEHVWPPHVKALAKLNTQKRHCIGVHLSAIYLAEEMEKAPGESFWWPWIQSLPSHETYINTHPAWVHSVRDRISSEAGREDHDWSPMNGLMVAYNMGNIKKCYDSYRLLRNQLPVKLRPKKLVDYQTYKYAYVVVSSRRFDALSIADDANVPLMDLINADVPKRVNTKYSERVLEQQQVLSGGAGAQEEKVEVGAPVAEKTTTDAKSKKKKKKKSKKLFCLTATKDIPAQSEIIGDYAPNKFWAMTFFSIHGFAFDPLEHLDPYEKETPDPLKTNCTGIPRWRGEDLANYGSAMERVYARFGRAYCPGGKKWLGQDAKEKKRGKSRKKHDKKVNKERAIGYDEL
ncbi:unnamed protein product [Amoebophrya sp. A120]|nr:unnamed protein product [Amoebophrya sp. A120]|eukprot:GSA120T00025432001.1